MYPLTATATATTSATAAPATTSTAAATITSHLMKLGINLLLGFGENVDKVTSLLRV